MKECIQTDRPLISIIMAVYNPNPDWLEKQLESIEGQTYRPLELIVCDDCSTSFDKEKLEETVKRHIKSIPFTVERNDLNMGSNKTFERLTKEAQGEYISYCDQDDVWKPEKTETLYNAAVKTGALLVCSDVCVIDENGKQTADSITRVRKRHKFMSGDNLSGSLIYKNFVIGCTSLVKANIAKEAVPFLDSMVHDHWLALFASIRGRIESCSKTLINYRIHSNNQTLVLNGVNSKDDYYRLRIELFHKRMLEIADRMFIKEEKQALEWAAARVDYFNKKKGSFIRLWKLKNVGISTSLFEIIMLKMPDFVFKIGIDAVRNGIL